MSYSPLFVEASDYDEIRDRLGNASCSVIPDDVITKPSYLQRAELVVRQRVPDFQDMLDEEDEDKMLLLKVAAITYTAYLLIPKVQSLVKSQDILDYSYTALSMSEWEQKAAALKREYAQAIAQLAPDTATTPTVMALAGPTRSGYSDL